MQKSKLLFFALCFLASGALFAQAGVKGGINFSAVGSYGNTEEGESVDLKTGYQIGALYQVGLSDKVALQVELNYERRGTISKKDYMINAPVVDPMSGTVLGIGDFAVVQEANSQQHYLNLPVLFVFGGERFQYYVGPNVAYMFSGTAEFDRTTNISLGGNPLPNSPVVVSLKDVDWFEYDSFKEIFINAPEEDGDFLNRLDIGINVGATYYLTDGLFADLRVCQGLTDTSNDHYDNSIYPDPMTFQFPSRDDVDRLLSIQLSFGYRF